MCSGTRGRRRRLPDGYRFPGARICSTLVWRNRFAISVGKHHLQNNWRLACRLGRSRFRFELYGHRCLARLAWRATARGDLPVQRDDRRRDRTGIVESWLAWRIRRADGKLTPQNGYPEFSGQGCPVPPCSDFRPCDHDHRYPRHPRRLDLGVGAFAAGIAADDVANGAAAQQFGFFGGRRGRPADNQFVIGQG